MPHKQLTADTFKRHVSVGRVVLINDPANVSDGKLAVIVEIVDAGRGLIQGPDVPRQAVRYTSVVLTGFTIKNLPRGAKFATVKKFWEKEEISKKWEATAWNAKRQARQTRRGLNDFQRFEVGLLKRERRGILGKAAAKAKKAA